MVYCRICHKSKSDEHFTDFPEHAAARSKADKAPRGGRLISADEQPEQAPRSPRPETPKRARPPQRAKAEQGGGVPVGLLIVAGLGLLAVMVIGAIWDARKQKKARQAEQDKQNNQRQRIEIEAEDTQDTQDTQDGG